MYADVDALRIAQIVDRFAPDGELAFGANPPAIRHAAMRAMLEHFNSGLSGMRQEWLHRWTLDETTSVFEALVHYTTLGGSEVPVPCATVIERGPSALINSRRVHMDPMQLLAALGAEAEAEAAQAAR